VLVLQLALMMILTFTFLNPQSYTEALKDPGWLRWIRKSRHLMIIKLGMLSVFR